MNFQKTSDGFTPLQKGLHWAVVALLVLQYFVFDGMGRPFRAWLEGTGGYTTTVIVHLTIGLAVLALALWRLSLRLGVGVPAAPAEEPELAGKAAKIAHVLIYLLMIALPVTGLVAWFGKAKDPGEMHELLTNGLLALVVLHVAAVAVHQFYWKTNLLARMR